MWLSVKTIIFSIVVPGVWTVLIPLYLTRGRLAALIASARGWHLLGWLFIGFGLFLYVLSAAGFVVKGHGTPAPFDPPDRLVIRGAHAYTRNPMYVAIVSVVLGLAVLSGLKNLYYYALGLFLLFYLIIMLSEEPALRAKYGDDYRDYCRKVPRW